MVNNKVHAGGMLGMISGRGRSDIFSYAGDVMKTIIGKQSYHHHLLYTNLQGFGL